MRNKEVACFACTTPYQLLGAISIAQKLDVDTDLYIFGMFPDYETIANRLSSYNIFSRIIPVDCSRYKGISKKKALMQVINSGRETARFLDPSIKYDSFYCSSRAHVKLLLQRELMRRNPALRIVIFEDGLGTYSESSSVLNTSKLRKSAEHLIGWNSFDPERISMMVRHPELLELPNYLKDVKIEKMPAFMWDETNREMLLDVFGVCRNDLINERVIIFDVTRGVYKDDLGVNVDLLDECYDMTIKKFSTSQVICKPHPRSRVSPNVDITKYNLVGVPMEVLYAGMADLENRILVGTFSTALFSPKMMFDVEPIVILLYKLVWPDNKEIPAVFKKLYSMYKHKERIIAPNSIEELKDYLE